MTIHTITLGGGCFWCTEAVFVRVRGVLDVESGYCNGLQAHQPSYEDVCRGDTGSNEVVRLQYDPAIISLSDLLTIFCSIHDPTSTTVEVIINRRVGFTNLGSRIIVNIPSQSIIAIATFDGRIGGIIHIDSVIANPTL